MSPRGTLEAQLALIAEHWSVRIETHLNQWDVRIYDKGSEGRELGHGRDMDLGTAVHCASRQAVEDRQSSKAALCESG